MFIAIVVFEVTLATRKTARSPCIKESVRISGVYKQEKSTSLAKEDFDN